MSTHKTMSLICLLLNKKQKTGSCFWMTWVTMIILMAQAWDKQKVLCDTRVNRNGSRRVLTENGIKFRSVFPSTKVFPPWNYVSWQTDASRNVGANFHVNKQQFFIVSKKVAVMQRYLGQSLLLFGWKIYCGGKLEKCLYCVTGWRRTLRVWVMFRKYFLSGSFIFHLALKEFLCGVHPPNPTPAYW